jgi:uncharacterized protein (DUF362 family)
MAGALPVGPPTIVKDNISWHLPFLSANTTPWQLEGTLRALRSAGHADLVAVHNDTVVTDPYLGQRLNKLDAVWKAYWIPELYNCRADDMAWVTYRPQAEMLALDRLFPEGIRIPEPFIGANVVHLPTVKCHVYTTTTGAMKNAFGGLLDTGRHRAHRHIHEALVDLLALQQEIHPGIFAVMDGTIAGDGPGPRTMRPVEKGLMLASADQVAVDAVAAHLMGFDPLAIPYIRLAHERGLGCGDVREIELAGDDVRGESWGFSVGANLASTVGRLVWHGPLRPLERLLFGTPLVHAFTLASGLYHDRIWWPIVGAQRQRRLRATSEWARLFDGYEPAGPAR